MTSHDLHCPHCGARIGEAPPSIHDVAPIADIRLDSGSTSAFSLPAFPDPLLGAIARADAPDDHAPETSATGLPAGLDLDAPSPAPGPGPVGLAEAGDSEEVVYVSGPNWPLLLLGSYASALTLALLWWVVLPRLRGEPDLAGFAPGARSLAAGTRRPDRARQVEPAPAIPADRVVPLGKSLTIGAVEITPLDVSRDDIRLRRASISGDVQERDGGSGAMSLRVRLRNVSDDLVFAPIDAAGVRDDDDGMPDSFVELGPTDRVYLYPLPVESEWSIVGQDFPVLKPGESRETRVVTAADFPATDAPMTWHLRVRTGLDSSATIGVATE